MSTVNNYADLLAITPQHFAAMPEARRYEVLHQIVTAAITQSVVPGSQYLPLLHQFNRLSAAQLDWLRQENDRLEAMLNYA